MAKPWEMYQAAASDTAAPPDVTTPSTDATKKPWERYAAPAPAVAPAATSTPVKPQTEWERGKAAREKETLTERALANPVSRLEAGLVSPIVGAAQLGANVGDWLANKIGLEPSVGKKLNEALSEYEATKRRGMAAEGDQTDVAGALGSIASGGAITKGIAPAASMVGKIAQGAGIGAGLGATTPQTQGGGADKYFDAQGKEIKAGAILGGAAQPVLSGVAFISKYPYHLVERYLPGGAAQAQGRALNKAAGQQAPQVATALEQAKPIVAGSTPTAGEAVVSAGSPGFSALQQKVSGINVDAAAQYSARRAEQSAARQAALSITPSEIVEQERKAATAPLRETALASANVAAQKGGELGQRVTQKATSGDAAIQGRWKLLTDAAKQSELSKNSYPVPGMPRFPAKYTLHADRVPENTEAAKVFENVAAQRRAEQKLLKYQLASIEQHGLKPLTTDAITGKLDKILADPAFKASNKAPILAAIKDKIAALTDKNGTIDANSLYTVRKEINETIENLLGPNASGGKKRAAELAGQIKPIIDKAIDSAAGGGWNQYIDKYTALSRKVDQSRILEYLNSQLTAPLEGGAERATVFANAIKNAPTTLNKTTGFGGYDKLEQVLTPEQMRSVTSVRDDIARVARMKKLAQEGNQAMVRQLGDTSHEIKLPSLLNRAAVLTNALIRKIQGGAGEKTLDELATIMQDPKETARLMRAANDREKAAIAAIKGIQTPKTTAGIVKTVDELRKERARRKAYASGGASGGTAGGGAGQTQGSLPPGWTVKEQ